MECTAIKGSNEMVYTILDLSSGRVTPSHRSPLAQTASNASPDLRQSTIRLGLAMADAVWTGCRIQ